MTDPRPPERAPAADLPERQGLLADDPEAVDAWYRREHPAVYRLCLGFLADPAEAEDVAQDAMLLLLDRIERYDPGRSWRAWRDTVVLNLCRDRARRRTRRRRHEQRAAAAALPPEFPDPAQDVSAGELGTLVAAALSSLSEREREAFVLRDLEGLSTRAAAEALGIGESSVRSLLTLARRRLRGVLATRLPVEVRDLGDLGAPRG